MKRGIVLFTLGILFGGLVVSLVWYLSSTKVLLIPSQIGKLVEKPKPLLSYTYENLRSRKYEPSEIVFESLTKPKVSDRIWQVSFKSEGRRISGVVNLPQNENSQSAWTKPVIILIHGFVDEKTYYPGFGTERVASELSRNGYVTIAPDFLGLGSSDKTYSNPFEDRFQTYVTVLNLIESVCNKRLQTTGYRQQKNAVDSSLSTVDCGLGIWGHSNGGQIALSVLEISGKKIPTVLWNPVSKPFPYNILFYTDEFDDQGKWLRKALSDFEETYDVEKYSLTNYFDWIKSPIFLQQGGADQQVPKWWSDVLNEKLKKKNVEIEYKTYPGADHNLIPSWSSAVLDTLGFFKKRL